MNTRRGFAGRSKVLVPPEHNPEDTKTAFFLLNAWAQDMDRDRDLMRDIVDQQRADYHAQQWVSWKQK